MINNTIVYEWFYGIIERQRRIYREKYIHVSELTQCLRRSYYNRTRVEQRVDVKNIILTIGNGIHRVLQEYLRETKGWSIEVELKINLGGFWLVGHADIITDDNEILELKTVSKIPGQPYINHLMQLNAYLYMGKAKIGYLIYIDKNKGNVKVFKHYRDNKLWNELKKRAHSYWTSLRNNKPPAPEFSPLCQYCQWKWLCLSKRGKK